MPRRNTQPVSELLRSLQVLAKRGRAPDLEEWVVQERDGYADDDVLPDYRQAQPARVLAHLAGPFGSQLKNFDIGQAVFPDYYKHGFKVEFRSPIAEIEDLLSSGSPDFSVPWTGDMIGHANSLINQGTVKLVEMHGIVAARKAVPRSLLVRLVERVRGRVLDLALELESLDPDLGSVPGSASTSPEAISATYQTVINTAQAFVGNNAAQIQNVNVMPGNVESLRRYLEGLGLHADQVSQLTAEAASDRQTGSAGGKLSAMMQSAAAGLTRLAPDAAMALINAAITKWIEG